MEASADQQPVVRCALSGHPTVVEVVRIASAMTQSSAEVVVFESEWAMVVGSLGDLLLQPRPLTPPELLLLLDGVTGPVSDENGTSTAIRSHDGSIVGALSIGRVVSDDDAETLRGLSRICGSLLATVGQERDWHETVLENLRDAVIVVDSNLRVTYANNAIGIQLGRTPAEVVGLSVVEMVHPDDVADAFDALVRLGNGAAVYRLGVRVLHGAGDYIRLEVTGRDLTGDPRVAGTVLSLRNGNHALELEDTLQRTRQLSNAVVEQLHDGIIATDAVGSLLVLNDAAKEILGLADGTATAGMSIDGFEFLDADGTPVARHRHPIRRALDGENIVRELMAVDIEGRTRNVVVSGRPVSDVVGLTIGAVIGFHDVTESRRTQRELQHLAEQDQLTGLPNRRRLKARVAEILAAESTGDRRPVAACLIDLDHFKVINDTHGHRIGDQVIRKAAERLAMNRRDDELLVRLGGDEFVVLSRDHSIEDVRRAADDMLRRLSVPVDVDGHRFNLTCSIGVAHLQLIDLDEDTLLRYADLALYAAKAGGRNRVVAFDHELAEVARTDALQREFLQQALEDHSLVMHFQPLIDSSTDEIVGFESLVRCRTASGGLVGPGQFLEAAAGSGLVWELDRQAFDLTCSAAAQLLSHDGSLTIACNFSALSIVQPDFIDHVDRAMARHDLRPSTICIEITESAALEAGPAALEVLNALHERGVRLALDDFGTGYSSLSHLRDLPLAIVKVDRSFIARLEAGSSEYSIAKAIVNLANDLGLGVVAEGVETAEQLAAAQAVGFNVIQGWHYSPARSLDDLMDMYSARSGGRARIPADWAHVAS